MRFVFGHPVLRVLAVSNLMFNAAVRVFGTVFLLYVARDLGYSPGVLGVVFALGGFSSLLGAMFAGRTTAWLGIGPAMIAAFLFAGVGQGIIPLAASTSAVALVLLIVQQFLTDPAWTVLEITQVSLRQGLTPECWQGRMNASLRVVEFGGMLLGAALGGWLGEAIGARATLAVAAAGAAAAGLPVLLSPVRSLRAATGRVERPDDMVNELP